MKIEVKKKDRQVHVTAVVPHYDEYGCKTKIRVNTGDVLAALAEAGHKNIGHCIKEGSINNKRKTTDVWVFQDTAPKQANRPTKKTKKVLDISPKDAIIKNKPTK